MSKNLKRQENGDCVNCDWYANGIKCCAKPQSCKKYNEFFKDKNKGKLKEGDFFYTLM